MHLNVSKFGPEGRSDKIPQRRPDHFHAVLHGSVSVRAQSNIKGNAEKIKSSFKIKHVRVLADFCASRGHPLTLYLFLTGHGPVLTCLTPSEMHPLPKMQLSCKIKEVFHHVKVVSNFLLPSSSCINK